MMAYRHVIGVQLANGAIAVFGDSEPRVPSEAKYFDAQQKVYEAFKSIQRREWHQKEMQDAARVPLPVDDDA